MKLIASIADLDAFIQQSPVALVELGAEWCKPCKILEPLLVKLEETHQVQVAKVDVQKVEEAQRRYQIMNLPTLILYRGGEQVTSLSGSRTPASIISHFDLAPRK